MRTGQGRGRSGRGKSKEVVPAGGESGGDDRGELGSGDAGAADGVDINLVIAGALSDLAIVHASPYGRRAFQRAARAVLALEEPVAAYVTRGELRGIPDIGPASESVIQEHLERGTSARAEREVETSAKRD